MQTTDGGDHWVARDVTIEIRAGGGRLVKLLSFGRQNTDPTVILKLRPDWRCGLPRGRYTYTVLATDLAGNPQVTAASARFVVK